MATRTPFRIIYKVKVHSLRALFKLPIVNQNAAGIDIGSRSHFVGIGQGKDQVREFGVYSEDLKELAQWLIDNKIETVAMESTGDYWQNLYTELIKNNIDVYLVNGKFTKTN